MRFKYYSYLSIVGILFLIFSCRKEIDKPIVKSYGSGLTVINDSFNGKEIVVVGNEGLQLLFAFDRRLEDGTLLEMQKASALSIPVICEDQYGNNWDVFGSCVAGPRIGESLLQLHSSQGFYFSFNAIYKGVEIYGMENNNIDIQDISSEEWSINEEFVFVTGGFDAIHAVDEPQFELYRSKDFIDTPFHVAPEDRITVVKVGDEIRAYPHNILSRHEVVNDVINDIPICINFCPLTGTGYVWQRENSTFGVSGMLYNNNLILYDRDTESLWSQILGESVYGEKIGENTVHISSFETTFESFSNIYDFMVDVMTLETGYNLLYEGNPYADYIFYDNFLLFPLEYQDDRLLNKARVMGIEVDGECKVYPYSEFN